MNSCARCGAELSPRNAGGVCVRCLLEGGLNQPLADPQVEASEQSIAPGTPGFSSPTNEVLRYFGDYELLEEIARGGMGVVYRARQPSLERIVAVKMILAGQFASKQIIQRFRGEVTAAALLQHPNIVAIHDVGIHEDQHYCSMDYVEGQNLSQLVGNRPLPSTNAARYVKLIAEAIQYAHQQGILHRDLKPSNILIDSATDQPRITDFGLAKRLDGESTLTVTGQVLGSPNFMPPEQASSDRGKVGRHSDVYGLGAILYYLLTARAPFQAESLESIITQVLQSDPVSPRILNPSVPRDLETICLKCLTKESSKRYATAEELSEELERFLQDEPIHARPVTRVERAWRWGRRNPLVASLWVALALAIIIGFASVTWQLRRISREESITQQNLYTADMNRVQQAWDQGNLQIAQELLRAHLPQAGKEDLRGFEWRYLWNLCRDESLFEFTNVDFAFSRRGLAIAADGETMIAASGETLRWLDWRKQRDVQATTIGTTAIVRLSMALDRPGLVAYRTDRVRALSPNGEVLLGGGLAPEWGRCSRREDEPDGAFALSWDGTLLAASGSNDIVGIFDVKSGQPLGPPISLGKDEYAFSIAFSPDSKYLACGTSGTKIHILEAPSFKKVNVLTNNTAFVHCLAFDSAGKKLVSGGNDSHVRVWSFPECALVNDLTGHQGAIGDLAFSPDGVRIASAGSDHTVRLWNLASPGTFIFLHGHRGSVKSVVFSRDGNQLFTGSADGTVKVWDVSSKLSTNILRHSGYTADVAFSPDGTFIAVADWGARTAALWHQPDQRRIQTFGEYTEWCDGVRFAADGKLLATVGSTVQIWQISPRKKNFEFPATSGGSIAFHPSRPLLAVGRGNLRFWDSQNGQQIRLLPDTPAKGVRRVVFSPNGEWIALGMQNGQVSIWNFISGRFSRSFQDHSAPIDALCFSHDNLLLASGDMDHGVVLCNVRQGTASRLVGHKDGVRGLAFAPDDKTLLSTSNDGTILFWSVANQQVALSLAHDGGAVSAVAFSPDGRLMATSGNDGTVRLWPAAKFEEITASENARSSRR
jgi:WD40 repeat protein/serine/threonine protein kinase